MTEPLSPPNALPACPIEAALTVIGGRWKTMILYRLLEGERGYAALRRDIPGITEKMLSQQLRELTRDTLIERREQRAALQRATVTYTLTRTGRGIAPVMAAMKDWGQVLQHQSLEPTVELRRLA